MVFFGVLVPMATWSQIFLLKLDCHPDAMAKRFLQDVSTAFDLGMPDSRPSHCSYLLRPDKKNIDEYSKSSREA